MPSKLAAIREALSTAQDMAKAHIMFVPVPVFDDADLSRVGAMAALRLMQLADAPRQSGKGE